MSVASCCPDTHYTVRMKWQATPTSSVWYDVLAELAQSYALEICVVTDPRRLTYPPLREPYGTYWLPCSKAQGVGVQ